MLEQRNNNTKEEKERRIMILKWWTICIKIVMAKEAMTTYLYDDIKWNIMAEHILWHQS